MKEMESNINFPLWKPQHITETKFSHFDYRLRLSALRNSSSCFIRKPEVRKILLDIYNNRCAYCRSKKNLQIDHITSIYKVAKGEFPIEKLNIRENLQILCRECNSSKNP